jgi:hypothetical protein
VKTTHDCVATILFRWPDRDQVALSLEKEDEEDFQLRKLGQGEEGEEPWPIGLALAILAGVTVLVSGRSAWFVGVLVLMVYLIFALTLYLLPPGAR